jgi:hypothetical protein
MILEAAAEAEESTDRFTGEIAFILWTGNDANH